MQLGAAFIWGLSALVYHVDSHPLCTDFSFPSARQGIFSTCTAYNTADTKVCVQPSNEARLILDYGISDMACQTLMQQISCSTADAWAAHLYDGETGSVLRIPYLCHEFAQLVYSTCGSVEMSTTNPFLQSRSRAANDPPQPGTITLRYPNEASFVANFTSQAYCFNGSPYAPPPVESFSFQGDDTASICVETVLETGSAWIVGIEVVPGFPDLLALVTKAGYVHLYQVGSIGSALSIVQEAFLDLSSNVVDRGEQGLLGVAFHPNFLTNGKFFVHYSCETSVMNCARRGDTLIEEYQVLDSTLPACNLTVDSQYRRFVLTVSQNANNHNGGPIFFSPNYPQDSGLYVALGDGGGSGDRFDNGQNGNTLTGAILRLDVDQEIPGYTIPVDNPFVNANDVASEIYALGMRNPWRCSFDAINPTRLFCADVGQGAVEEVDLIVRGGNYGWPRFEGTQQYSNRELNNQSPVHQEPVVEYLHSETPGSGASVTGGFLYRSATEPKLQDTYIFGDLYNSVFFVAQESPPLSGQFTAQVRAGLICSPNSPLCCETEPSLLLTFGQDAVNRDVYISTSNNGIYRIVNRARDCDDSVEQDEDGLEQTDGGVETGGQEQKEQSSETPDICQSSGGVASSMQWSITATVLALSMWLVVLFNAC